MEEDDEATLPREARVTTPLNLDLARLHVSTPDHRQVTSPVPVITLLPVQEQVASEEAPTAAPLIQEQVAPEEAAPEPAASEEVEMAEEEVLEEESIPDEATFMFGVSKKNLTAEDQAKLEERRKQWDAEDRINQQKEHDEQIAAQLQLDEQRRVDHPIQLGPAKKTVALPTEREVERAGQAFGDILLDTDTSPTPPSSVRKAVAPPTEEEV